MGSYINQAHFNIIVILMTLIQRISNQKVRSFLNAVYSNTIPILMTLAPEEFKPHCYTYVCFLV
jgi:hypothetical protein